MRQLGSGSSERANGVAVDTDGTVYLTGWSWGSLGGPSQGSADTWLAKYDTDGHPQWRRQFGTWAFDAANAVATDGAGNVYLAGFTQGAVSVSWARATFGRIMPVNREYSMEIGRFRAGCRGWMIGRRNSVMRCRRFWTDGSRAKR